MIKFICDSPNGDSHYLEFEGWDAAQAWCDQRGWTLVGEYVVHFEFDFE